MPTRIFRLPDARCVCPDNPSSPSVIVYNTLKELNDASQLELDVGYYSVPNVGITYWDGVKFFPYLQLGAPLYFDAVLEPVGVAGIIPILIGSADSFDGDSFKHSDLHDDMDVGSSWSAI